MGSRLLGKEPACHHVRSTEEIVMRLGTITAAALAVALAGPAVATGTEAEALVALGFPALSRPWRGADYASSAQLVQAGKVALPRLDDPRGSAILQRLLAPENLTFARSRSLPFATRAQDYGQIATSVGSWMLLYLRPISEGQPPAHAELARLTAFLVEVGAVGEEILEEVQPTLEDEPAESPRRQGFQQTRSGLMQIFQGAEQMLTESAYGFTAEDHALILRAMATHLPRIKKVFPGDVAMELRKRLQADQAHFSGENRAYLARMVRELSPSKGE
jgi:hypothetical protein